MDLREVPGGAFTRHPWEVARFRFFLRVLQAAGAARAPASVLDVGSGDAWFASRLVAHLPAGTTVVCWDAGYEDPALGRAEAARGNVSFSATRPTGRFGIVLLLDVLEHVDDDRSFLQTLVRENLADGALVLVSVPGWRILFSEHDRRLRHRRRYDAADGEALVAAADLRILRHGGLFHSLLLPRALAGVVEAVSPAARDEPRGGLEWRWGPRLERAVAAWLAVDTALSFRLASAGRRFPVSAGGRSARSDPRGSLLQRGASAPSGALPRDRERRGLRTHLRRRRFDRPDARDPAGARWHARRAGRDADAGQERRQGRGREAGMLRALDRGAAVVGYLDADLSTPVEEIIRLAREMTARNVSVVMGARVALLGSTIERSLVRHYLGLTLPRAMVCA